MIRWTHVGAALTGGLLVLTGAMAFGTVGRLAAGVSSGERSISVPLQPARLLETRPAAEGGDGTVDGQFAGVGALAPGGTIDVTIAGRGGVPADATGVVLNITAVGQRGGDSFITVWPTGSSRPLSSNLNPSPGQPPAPNSVTVKLGANGQISLYTLNGPVHLIADVAGYYVDHNHDDRYVRRPAQVVWVATSGGDFASVQAAIDSISDASPTRRYTVRIAPGVYPGKVTLKSYVDLEGAGEAATVLTSVGTSQAPDLGDSSATLRAGAVVADVRNLTVEATGPAQYVTGIRTASSSGDFVLHDVTVLAGGGTSWTTGIYNKAGSPTIDTATITLSGGPASTPGAGIWNASSSPTIIDPNINANMGVSTVAYGILNHASASLVTGGLVSASANGSAFGMVNLSGSTPRVDGTRFVAFGALSTSYGVWNTDIGTNANFQNIDAAGFVAPDNGGIKTSGGAVATVRNSRLAGVFAALSVDNGSTTRLILTLVEGGIQQLSNGDNVCSQVSGLTGGGVLSEVNAGLC